MDIFLLLPLDNALVIRFLSHVSGISNGVDSLESKVYIKSKHIVDMPTDAHPAKGNNVNAHNGDSLTSNQVVPSGKLDQPLW